MKRYFSKRRRSRSRRRKTRSRRRKSRRSRRRRKSRSRRRRKSRSKSKRKRVGNKVHMANGKVLKVQKDKDGNEFIRSGKSKSKTYVGKTGKQIKKKKSHKRRKSRKSRKSRRRRKSSSKKRRRRRRKRFGKKPGLISIMGNYSPSKMNSFQQYTGMSAPQMTKHMSNVLKSDRANFYANL